MGGEISILAKFYPVGTGVLLVLDMGYLGINFGFSKRFVSLSHKGERERSLKIKKARLCRAFLIIQLKQNHSELLPSYPGSAEIL
jgi:hypothetical protein